MDNFKVIFVNVFLFQVWFSAQKLFASLIFILKFSQHQWIVKIWNNCFLLLFLKLFAAHNLLETYVMRDHSDLSHTPNINKNLLLEVVVVFCYFLTFSQMCIVCWGLIPWKQDFTSLSLLLFTKKKISRSSYDVIMAYYDVILILLLFRFVANVQDL